jgi:hypothetical protein
MQLDRTAVVIRERGFFEILDLALRMLTRYPKPILQAWAAMTVPMMLANYVCLRSIVNDYDERVDVLRYVNTMIVFVTIQAPLVSILLTTYLGRVVFMEETRMRNLLQTAWQSGFALFWHLGLLRATLLAWPVYCGLRDAEAGLYLVLFFLTAYVIIVRAIRPFILEIILLEGNPLRAKTRESLTISRRSRSLHHPNAGELAGRWLAGAAISAGMFGSIVATYWFFSGMVLLSWEWDALMVHIVIPAALWAAAGFMAIVRFLSYVDLRIRNEGWEVELLVRAAAEQFRDSYVA